MQHQANRMRWAGFHAALRVVGVAAFCFVALSWLSLHSSTRAYAAGILSPKIPASNPPSVSISPSTITANTVATITANNYFPAGTRVTFLWMSGNTIVENLHSEISNTSGVATLTFTVPQLSITSGTYTISAFVGDGQPISLSSSTNFTFHATGAPQPSPTLSPTPSLTPTQSSTPTASATTTNGATPAAGSSSTVGSGQTSTTNGTSGGSNGGSNNDTSAHSTGSSKSFLVMGGIAGLLALLAGLAVAVILNRRRKAARLAAKPIPPRLPNSANPLPWSNPQGVFASNSVTPPPMNFVNATNNSATGNPNAGQFSPYASNAPVTPLPQVNNMPVMGGASMQRATPPAPGGPMQQQQQAQPVQPPARLADAPVSGVPTDAAGSRPILVSADPTLEAMRRQAQSGLYVAPRQFHDERSV